MRVLKVMASAAQAVVDGVDLVVRRVLSVSTEIVQSVQYHLDNHGEGSFYIALTTATVGHIIGAILVSLL